MEFPRLLDCLESDFTRLRSVVPPDLDAVVPTCPDWTVADLTRHVGAVYLHKTACMRGGVEPDDWPPKGLEDEEPLALLDRGYAELRHEFATRKPEDPAGGWYVPDRTVGFLIRRMAQETVIHRIDAELGAGQPVVPIPDDLAVDGIDELLKIFVAYGVAEWSQYFTEVLAGSPGRTYAVRTGRAAWRIRTGPGTFTVADGDADPADVTVSGTPAAVLRWVWNREGGSSDVMIQGPPEAVEELKRCITTATQ
jgi:uncharacterized protein (TIGR03083 family)